MDRAAFLRILRDALAGLPPAEVDDIVSDYAAHFDEARAAGRDEAAVAASLGDPDRLARELRAETGLRRWEDHRSPGNFARAWLALGTLAAVDLVVLLPVLFAVVLAALAMALVVFVLGIIGIGALLSLFKTAAFASLSAMAVRATAGVALLAASLGSAALLVFALNRAVTMLARYARLHYRLLRPKPDPGSIGGVT
jgi:uncharacterized membrane protein